MLIVLTLQHTFLFNHMYSYISWAVFLWLSLASIVKWKHFPSRNLHTLICQLLPDHVLSIIILPLFPIPRLIVHQSLPHSNTIYRVSQEERAKLREGVPYVKLYRYNPKHLCPKLNGYGDKGQRKVWSFCGSTYCTWFAWRNTHTLRIVRPCLQLAQARSSLRLHM